MPFEIFKFEDPYFYVRGKNRVFKIHEGRISSEKIKQQMHAAVAISQGKAKPARVE